MWNSLSWISSTVTSYIWGVPVPEPAPTDQGPKVSSLEEDYETISNPEKLKGGLRLTQALGGMGKVIFDLGDFALIPIGAEWKTDKKTLVKRSSDTEIELDGGAKIITIPQHLLKQKQEFVKKIEEQTKEEVKEIVSRSHGIKPKEPSTYSQPAKVDGKVASRREIFDQKLQQEKTQAIDKNRLEKQRKEEEERKLKEEEDALAALEEQEAQKKPKKEPEVIILAKPIKHTPATSTVKPVIKGESCDLCGKRVYPVERVAVGGAATPKVYHQGCFKCKQCNRPLTVNSYATGGSDIYCKPHFLAIFREKGTYADTPTGPPQKDDSEGTKANKFATISRSSKIKDEIDKPQESTTQATDSTQSSKFATLSRAKAGGRKLPSSKRRTALHDAEDNEETEPPKTTSNQSDDIGKKLDAAIKKAEAEKKLLEEEERIREEKENKRKEEEQSRAQTMLSSVIRKTTETSVDKMLLHIKGKRRVRVRRTRTSSMSLNTGDVFLLDCGKKIFVWNGSGANRMEKAKAMDVSQRLAKSSGARVIVLEEGEEKRETEEFWKELGGKVSKLPPDTQDDEVYEKEVLQKYRLYKVEGVRATRLDTDKGVSKKLLESEYPFILDTETELYCWIGKKSSKEDRGYAMDIAEQLLTTIERPDWCYKELEIKRIVEGGETLLFREKFSDWPDSLPIAQANEVTGNIASVTKIDRYDVARMFEFQMKEEELVDEGTGETTIWVVNGFSKDEIPIDEKGVFYSKCCYIVLYKYVYRTGPQGNWIKYILYYWQGLDSTKNDKGTCSLLATDVFKEINKSGGEIQMYRQIQNKECRHFKMIFKNRLIVRKGERDVLGDTVTLFKIRESQDPAIINAIEVSKNPHLLNPLNSFILRTPSTLYLWFGKGVTSEQQRNVTIFAASLKNNNQSNQVIHEGSEPNSFWKAIDSEMNKKPSYPQYLYNTSVKARLFSCSEGTGVFDVDEIYQFSEEDLAKKHAYILDAHHEIFVWCGLSCSEYVKKLALLASIDYAKQAKEQRKRELSVWLVTPGTEPHHFVCHFSLWESVNHLHSLPSSSVLTLVEEALREYDKVYTLEELKTSPPKFLDKTRLELYLSDEEFQRSFGMTKDAWASVPTWKAQEMKKKLGLY